MLPPSLLRELKRRKVFRVAGVYALVAFVIVQVADIVFPALHLPGWTVTLVVALALLGFPIALVLVWAFELTPEGVKRTEAKALQDAALAAPEGTRSKKGVYAGAVVAAVVLGAVAYAYLGSSDAEAESRDPITSIAVLPFADMSPGGDQEYFSDGITEELLDALAQVQGLRVPARTSSFAFKGTNADVREIASQLSVEAVLEGSVRRDGDRVRITAQLINAADGYHLWSRSYDRRLTDIFAVQGDISTAIVDALRVELSPGERDRLKGSSTDNVLAYEFYLRGKEYVRRQGHSSSENRNLAISAITLFREAIREDPEHAPAWAGLAWAYSVWTDLPLQERTDSSAAFARTAVQLDPGFSDGHTELGLAYLYKGDREAAFERWRHAVELNPNDAMAHSFIGAHLWRAGEVVEALRASQRAVELDPAYFGFQMAYANNLASLGLYDRAEQALREAARFEGGGVPQWQVHCHLAAFALDRGDLEAVRLHGDSAAVLAPDVPYAWSCDGQIRAVLEEYPEATRQLERFAGEDDDADAWHLVELAHVHQKMSDTERAERWLEEAEARLRADMAEQPEQERAFLYPVQARIQAVGGDLDAAMESLHQFAEAEPSYWSFYYVLRRDFTLENLRGHPPFEALLAAMRAETDRARERVVRASS